MKFLLSHSRKNEKRVPGFSNILLIQLGDIGDVVLTTPAVRAVKETYPEAEVTILVRKPFGSLLGAETNLHEVIEFAKPRGAWLKTLRDYFLFARRLRRANYDLVVDLRTGDRGSLFSYLTGAQVRVGRYAEKSLLRRLCFTRLLPNPPYAPLPVHPGADQSLRVVRALGMDTRDSMPTLHVSAKDRDAAIALLAECSLTPGGGWVTVNPCSRWKYKEWNHKKWMEMIDLLWREHRLATVLIGSSEEAQAIEGIVSGRSEHAFNLAGRTTLGELTALISMSSVHFGVDSAAPHIAMAVGTPSLTIFGPGNWKSWTVNDELHRVITAQMPCIPCNRMGCENSGESRCLDLLSAGTVYAEANAILAVLGREDRPGEQLVERS